MAKQELSGGTFFDNKKIGSIQKRFLWLAAIYYIFDIVDQSTVQYAVPTLMKVWKITLSDVALNNSLTMLGACLGAIIGGWYADKVGRKLGLLSMITIFSLASIATGLAPGWTFFVAVRFVVGFSAVAMVVIAMVYIAEMLPSEGRGRYQALTVATGSFFAPIYGLAASYFIPLYPENGWRWMFIISGASIFLVFLGISWLKESPRWLASKGRISEAEKLLEYITGEKAVLSDSVPTSTPKSGLIETLKTIFRKEYRLRTFVLIVYLLGIVVGGAFLNQFYTAVLAKCGIPQATVLRIVAISFFGIPLGDLIASYFADKGGRKMTIASYCFVCVACFIVQGSTLIPIILVVSLFVTRIFAGGSLTLLYSYLAESYPTNVRSNASGMLFGVGRFIAAMIQLAVPGLYAAYGWSGINYINSLIFLVPGVVVLIWGERTANISLEELNPNQIG
jgi:Arabinose efflux permease